MKWVAFYAMIIFGVPLMTMAAHSIPRARRILFAALVFTTCVKVSVNFVSSETYRGPDRGFEVTVTDLIAISLGASLIMRKPTKLKFIPPNTIPMLSFFLIAVISVSNCAMPLYGWFSLFKLMKAFWLYWVVYNTFALEPPEEALWYGIVSIAGYETFVCLQQKYLHGMYRVNGTFDHSNSIPIYLIMTTPLILAWILNGRHMGRLKTLISLAALGGNCVCILATQSRAGLVLTGAALVGVVFRLVPHRLSGRKVGLSILFAVLTATALTKAAPTIIRRFKEAPKSSEEARHEFNQAAVMMAKDHTFGVGYNLFSHAMTHVPKYKAFAHVMGDEEQSGVCHHIYHLTEAETGKTGLLLFLWVMVAIHFRLFYRLWGAPDFARCVVVSVFIGLSMVHVIGMFEWCFRLTPQTNMFMIVVGVSMAYCHHIGESGRAKRREAAAKRAQLKEQFEQQTPTPNPAPEDPDDPARAEEMARELMATE